MSEHISTFGQPPGGFTAISKYNPHLWSAEQLRAIFVARKNELADLLHTLESTPPDMVGQHVLLVGARGMGKSTLMRRLALAVEDDPSLSTAWIPLRFPEEQYTVATLGQFWANVLDSLTDALQHMGESTSELDADAQRIVALPAAEQAPACLAAIDRFADERGQRLLLLVDNTDQLLQSIGRDNQWALRATLQSNPRMLWIGGSYQTLEAESDYHDAFLDFFRVIPLRPLSLNEMAQALLALAETFGGKDARQEMERQLAAQPERLPTLRRLSGGNPRTTVMLFELFANGHKGNVRNDLEALLDNMTPLYKSRMDALADVPRKLLAHILEHWAPVSLAELATASQIVKTTISTQLQRLEQEGLIEKTRLRGTTRNGYQATERFFNIWYLMRLSPRRQRNRLNWLVEFMRLWFSNDDLCSLAQHRMHDIRSTMRSTHDLEYDRALADALPAQAPERHTLRWSLLKQLKENHCQLVELFDFEGADAEFKGADDYLRRLNRLHALLHQCPHAKTEEERTRWTETILGSFTLSLSEKERMAEASLNRDKYEELVKMYANNFKMLENRFGKAAVQAVRSAVLSHDFFPDMPDSHLAYDQIHALFNTNCDALRLVSKLFYSRHEDIWCYMAQKLALAACPQDARIAFRCAWLLHVPLARYKDAEAAYRQSIALDDKYARPWNNLGNLLKNHLGRFEDAEAAYRQAIALDDKYARPWIGLGNLLQDHLDRFEDAEVAYRQAIALDDKDANPWYNLGYLLQVHLGRFEDAEAAYRQAIALDDKYAKPWYNLGYLLQVHLGRFEDAEAAYRQAIALDDKYAKPWNSLGNLLQVHLGRFEDAEAAYRQAIALDDKDAYTLANLARLLAQTGRMTEAGVFYRESVSRTSPDNQNLLLQAHLFLGNHQLAMDALQTLAMKAQMGDHYAFFRLKEQVWECHEIGLGERLADLMAESEAAGFLAPFVQALYTLAGSKEKLRDLPMESQQMADEIVNRAHIRQKKI